MKRAFDETTIQGIRQRYADGMSTRELSDMYYCDNVTIWHYVRDIKVHHTRVMKISDARARQIVSMYRLGVYQVEIARRLGISKKTVYNYIKLGYATAI